MTEIRLVLEHAPTPQAETEVVFRGGQLVVGRGADADWRIHDPSSFVSRKHFVLSMAGSDVVLTDASSGGLFVDAAAEPLGPGNSIPVGPGMRLRFGDFVARIEIEEARDAEPAAPAPGASPFDFAFDPVEARDPPPARPESLPPPFAKTPSRFFGEDREAAPAAPDPIDRDNPFALGLKPAPPVPAPDAGSGGGYFDSPVPAHAEQPDADHFAEEAPAEKVVEEAAAPPPAPPAVAEDELRRAFFRGMGLEPDRMTAADPVLEMEAMGRRFRALADGLTQLLRARAAEKQKVRLAQTIIGASHVNPLKFAVSAEEAVASLVRERGAGYLDPDASIDEAFRDLTDHQMRTWSALQTALRRMIDKFDPGSIAQELEETGLLETLIAGGRNAKLWQLYQERYGEIARAAEERFLGEVGADFRDAYEEN